MPEVGIRELKSRASQIVRNVRERRARYTITYRGRPVGVLLPLEEAPPERDGEEAWDRFLMTLEDLGEHWESSLTSAEILSEMRR